MSGGRPAEKRAAGSRWHRLRHTPLRDVLRCQISGRLDVEQAIGAFELPDALAELVRTTTRRTRLWRLEKVEVARELAAHFQDGIDAGAMPEDLATHFGNARQAARLIRRAKIRNRALWKATRCAAYGSCGLIVGLIVLYILLAIRVYTGTPCISRDYLAEMNAPALATAEENRAWPLYRRAFLLTESPAPYEDIGREHERWPEVVAYARRHREAIELYHTAAAKPRLGRIYGTADDLELWRRNGVSPQQLDALEKTAAQKNPSLMMQMSFPELQCYRDAATLLLIDARVGATEDDGDRVCQDLETALRMIAHIAETPGLIGDLIAVTVLELGLDSVCGNLCDQPELFTEEHLLRISHCLSSVMGDGGIHIRVSKERCGFADIVQRMYTDDGNDSGRLVGDGWELLRSVYGDGVPFGTENIFGLDNALSRPALMSLVAGRQEIMRKYNELMSAIEAEALVPLWQRRGSQVGLEIVRMSHASMVERIRYLPLVVLMPTLSRASMVAERATQRRDAMLAALACELYRRHNGRWPDTLADLSPHYLPSPPVDRFDGQPLRYRLTDGQPVIYSIGADCNDDGGRPPEGGLARQRVREWHYVPFCETPPDDLPDGDWVLWPPDE